MSILTLVQSACYELGVPAPSSLVGSTDAAVLQLLALTKRAIKNLSFDVEWPKLNKEYTFTLATSVENYAFPVDFDRKVFRTDWNRTRKWELIGPISAQEWQFRKSGIVSTTPRQYFRVKSWELERFFIFPTPAASDNGQTIAFEYQSSVAVVPKTWTTATVFGANSYCSYDSRIYQTTAGGTTGATAPTHTVGSVSDGAVTWTYYSAAYPGYIADTDYSLIDEDLVTLYLKYLYLDAKGLDSAAAEKEYRETFGKQYVIEKGAKTLSLNHAVSPQFISGFNVPDSGYGT